MQLNLENHKANIFEKNPFDSKKNIDSIPSWCWDGPQNNLNVSLRRSIRRI